MKIVPRSMVMRVVATLVLAVVAVLTLDFAVRVADARSKPLRPAFAVPRLPPPVRLAPVTGPVLLTADLSKVPPGAAPVVQVFTDGGYALRRPSPVPSRPGATETAAAIVLPVKRLARLDARARATFVEVLGALIPERPVLPERFVTLDFTLARPQLARVLAWVR